MYNNSISIFSILITGMTLGILLSTAVIYFYQKLEIQNDTNIELEVQNLGEPSCNDS